MEHDIKNIDKVIAEKFTASFMNDTKWDKLLQTLTDTLSLIIVNYKLIYSDEICHTSFDTPDFKPFFIEPVFYKEVEWIEFLNEYEMTLKMKDRSRIVKTRTQDIGLIKEIIEKIGEFVTEENDDGLRLYAYQ